MSIEDVLSGKKRSHVELGDSAEVLTRLSRACVDAVVTDPPAGINFMGLEFDRDRGGRAQWVAWLAEVLGHARAATRDGGRALVWSLPRTSHWTGCAVEDAGWSIETTVTHLFGTGWPKGKSQLKPLAETWWLARTGRSTALNIEACRVQSGASPSIERREVAARTGNTPAGKTSAGGWERRNTAEHYTAEREGERTGRYPPNAVFSHAPGCRCVGERRVAAHQHSGKPGTKASAFGLKMTGETRCYADPDGTELVEAWECDENCPVAELDRQSGELGRAGNLGGTPRVHRGFDSKGAPQVSEMPAAYNDATSFASRFFPCFPADEYALFGYHAKPSRAERDAGVDGGNVHSTVKSIALMRWLIRLVTQPGDVVLDPFGGSGTTGAAALAEGRRVILVERDPRFAEIARQRLEHVTPDMGRPVRVAPSARAAEPAADPRQLSLLGGAL